MMYLGGVTLGYFNLYPVGFQPKDEQSAQADTAGSVTEERLPSKAAAFRRPAVRCSGHCMSSSDGLSKIIDDFCGAGGGGRADTFVLRRIKVSRPSILAQRELAAAISRRALG